MSRIHSWWLRRRADILCLVVITGLATLFMHRFLRPGYTSLPLNLESAILPWHKTLYEPPQNLLISDPFYIFYPARVYLTQALRSGMLPLWNPYLFGGHPLLGDTNMPNYYPPTLLAALVLAPERALPLLAWLHVIISGALMYSFLRTLSLRPLPALLGAVIWMFNEFTVVWLETPHFLGTLAWMPGMFACFELAVRRRNIRFAFLGGLTLGLEFLGGQTQLVLYSALLLGLYALFHTLAQSWAQRRLDAWPLLTLAVVGGVGVGVGAVQLLPTYQMTALSHRFPRSLAALLETRWPLRHSVTLWLPDFFGNALRYDYRSVQNFAETAAYFGVIPALLCLICLFVNRRRPCGFAAGLLVGVILIAGGTWLVRWIAWLPGFRYFNLSRMAGLLAFPGAMLAAGAADAILNRPTPRLIAGGLGAALAAITLVTGLTVAVDLKGVQQHWNIIQTDMLRTGLFIGLLILTLILATRRPRLGTTLLILLTFADLYQWGEPFNPVYSTRILYPQNEVVEALKQDSSLYRILPLRQQWAIFGPGVSQVFGLSELGGSSSLVVRRYQELLQAIDSEVRMENTMTLSHFRPLHSMLNVKYVLSSSDLPTTLTLARYEGCAQQSAPLVGDDFFEQSFVAADVGLNRVDVMVAHVGIVGEQPVHFRLWRGDADGELVADIATSAQSLPDHGAGVFFFAPTPDALGERFTWRIEAPGASPTATVAVCLADGVAERTASFVAYGVLLQQVDFRQGIWIYQNPNALPRAYIVHHVEVAPEQALAALQSPGFRMARTAVLEDPLPPAQAATLSPQPIRSTAQATVTRYEAHRVEITAQTPTSGILVLSDVYYPGWKVFMDGRAASLLRVNHTLRGVYLPAGSHSITFVFRPGIFYGGLAMTVLTTISVLAVWGGASLSQGRDKRLFQRRNQ